MAPNCDLVTRGKLCFRLVAESEEGIQQMRRRLALDFSPIETESGICVRTANGRARQVHQWISTTLPISISELADIKRYLVKLETSFLQDGLPSISIEPGYVTATKVVFARTTDADHRVFLSQGVYAEPILRRRPEADPGLCWEPWPWTRTEDSSPESAEFFERTRQRLLELQAAAPAIIN